MGTHIIHFLQGRLKVQPKCKETKVGDWTLDKIWEAPSPALLWHLVADIAAFFHQILEASFTNRVHIQLSLEQPL